MRPLIGALSLSLVALCVNAAERDISRDLDGNRHVVLRAAAPLSQADREDLAARGIVIQRAMAGGRYIARVTGTVSDARVASVEPLSADEKIHSSAYREAARGRALANVKVFFHDDISFDNARSAVLSAGGALEDVLATSFAPMRYVSAKIPAYSLTVLASDDRVLMISGPRGFGLKNDNATSAAVSHVTDVLAAPYGLTGQGVAVSLFELAQAQETHVEFGGRMTQFASGGSSGDKQHATHVAGTIGAAGVREDAKGMAPKASIFQYRVSLGASGEPLYHTPKDTDLITHGIVADNNSWGFSRIGWSNSGGFWVWEDTAEYYGAYDYEYTAPLDEITRNRGVLFVHSAGNEGDDGPTGTWGEHRHVDAQGSPDTTKTYCYSQNLSGTDCPAPGCTAGACETAKHHTLSPYDTLSLTGAAKNVITVGAVDSQQGLLALSSRGPAKDGRVKPDVVARGSFVVSSVPTNSYGTASGTSMASPVVTGIAALITEQYRRTFAKTPIAQELKALIIAGADDLGRPGPDYAYGFGLADAKKSVDLLVADKGNKNRIRTVSVEQGQTFEMPIVVSAGENVRVVLHWADPPVFLPENQVHTAKALVNDLDLKVIGPTGATVLPYVLDKNNITADATRGVNTVDNTEELEIANAAAGAYRIQVKGTAIPQGPQSATIVTTARAARTCSDVQEPNDSAGGAFGNLSSNANIHGGFCAASDVDFYKFQVTKAGPIVVEITTGDTPVRVTVDSMQVSGLVDVPAYSTRTLATSAVTGASAALPLVATLKIEATGTLGVEPDYDFTLKFGQASGTRRRSARH